MNISKEVEKSISRFAEGQIFKYSDIPLYKEKPDAVVAAVCRMAKKDRVQRLSNGQYYIPRQTLFGTLRPKDSEIIRSYLFSGKRQVGYVTGLALYNKWGLTTQVPHVIQIATTEKNTLPKIKGLSIKLEKPRYPKISKNNSIYLQILDVIQNLNKIPDSEPSKLLAGLKKQLETLKVNELKVLEKIAVESYKPSTRALLGALLEAFFKYPGTRLKRSVNPLSRYKVGLIINELPNAKNWFLN